MKRNKDNQAAALGDEMIAGMSAFNDAIEAGEAVGKMYTIRTVCLDLEPKPYGPEDVKHVRAILKASQALLAKFLGVSVKTLSSWEQGARPVPPIACRYLDDIVAYPEIWQRRLQSAISRDGNKATESV